MKGMMAQGLLLLMVALMPLALGEASDPKASNPKTSDAGVANATDIDRSSVTLTASSADANASVNTTEKAESSEKTKTVANGDGKEVAAAEAPRRKPSRECLASEEIIQDIELREKKMKEREEQLAEKEKDIEAQKKIISEELAKLEAARGEIQGIHAKELAEREEKVNKLIETFETMSPKAAAGVIAGIDDELAVTALSRLSTTKAGKILANLKPEKSSQLSELMAFGKTKNEKEKTRGESVERAPANSAKR